MENLSSRQEEFIKYGVVLGLGTGALVWVYSKVKDCKERQYFLKLINERQEERRQTFATMEGQFKMTAEARGIVELNLKDLQEQLRTRKLTAVQVLKAYTAKALEVNTEVNCVTEFNPRATEMAAELDGKSEMRGPLHGIPFCVKDDTHVFGMDSTVGYTRNLNKRVKVNAVIVQVLIDLGAIPFCQTNLPQTCISVGSHNPIYGKTLNPLNKNLGPGGSSSGTGALIAAGGALFGIGTDTGGSARIPSQFCGLSTIKSSKNRVSRKGCLLCIDKCIGIVSTPCIMAKYPREVSAIFQAMMENNLHNQYDGKAVPLPWNQPVFESSKKLRIGFYTSLRIFPSVGDTAETVLFAKSALEKLGHTLVPFELSEVQYYAKIIRQLTSADLGVNVANLLHNDQISPSMKGFYENGRLPRWKRRLWAKLPAWMNYYNPQSLQLGLSAEYSSQLWDIMAERRIIIDKMLKRMREENIDLILCPVWPYAAVNIERIMGKTLGASVMYTFLWNLMDFPAGVLKVGKESGKHFVDQRDKNWNILAKSDRMGIRESVGMPIGVQIVGKPFEEELVLRIMVELDKQIHG